MLIKFFLVSSRSFKHDVSLNSSFHTDIRDLILETQMPKFVWIAELSNEADIKKKMAEGLLILDSIAYFLNTCWGVCVIILIVSLLLLTPLCSRLNL